MYSSKVLSALMGKLKREVWQWEQGKEEKIQKEGYKKKQDKEKAIVTDTSRLPITKIIHWFRNSLDEFTNNDP